MQRAGAGLDLVHKGKNSCSSITRVKNLSKFDNARSSSFMKRPGSMSKVNRLQQQGPCSVSPKGGPKLKAMVHGQCCPCQHMSVSRLPKARMWLKKIADVCRCTVMSSALCAFVPNALLRAAPKSRLVRVLSYRITCHWSAIEV